MSSRARITRSACLVGLTAALALPLVSHAQADPGKAMERHLGHRHGHSHGGQSEQVTVRRIGRLDSVLAESIRSEVNLVPFAQRGDNTPILLQGDTLSRLDYWGVRGLKATYLAGYSIVLLDATLSQVNALHRIIGEGVNYRSKNSGTVMTYSLRRQNFIPTVTMLSTVDPSPLQTPSGDKDSTGAQDEENAFDRAADITIAELEKPVDVGLRGPVRDPNQPIDWLANPVQSTTFAINGAQGVYNTSIGVYALHSCDSGTDHYAVSALGDWTATAAKWQSAGTEVLPGASGPTMFQDSNGNLVVDWRDDRIQCSSPTSFGGSESDICRYINYPLSYSLTMAPQNEGTVTQVDAKPSATQGQQTSYTSGFSFSVSGTVNVSAQGPGGGLGVSATWNNTTQTTVPPLIVDVQNTGNTNDEGVNWTFKYCTDGLEPDPGTNCTSHVQMVKDVCQAQLGNDAGNNPQQGQTPVGKLSNSVQSAHWQASPDTRANNQAFDIEVAFTANLATTVAHLGGANNPYDPDPDRGCNEFNCGCVSETKAAPVSKSLVFQIPFPSTMCQ